MRAPPILLLQLLNVLVAGGIYLALSLGAAIWTASGWSPTAIALPVTFASLTYGICVSFGGRCADRYGRARVSMGGAIGCGLGCLVPVVIPHPLASAIALIVVFGSSAFFFPGIAAMCAEASHAQGADALPLHRRVSQYNLGWSLGNVTGLGLTTLLLSTPVQQALGPVAARLGYALWTVCFAITVAVLWAWRSQPSQPPPAVGDRSDHPALPGLTLLNRLSLLMACLVGFSLTALLDKALAQHRPTAAAAELGTQAFLCYCAGYCSMFWLLGHWGGWVLRPWRLTAIQLGLLLGPLVLIACGLTGFQPRGLVLLALTATGWGYGAAYTGSIYYSLRLPHGAARAAGLHETFLGIGNTAGPVLCGIITQALTGVRLPLLAGVGAVAALFAAISLGMQVGWIPRLRRLQVVAGRQPDPLPPPAASA